MFYPPVQNNFQITAQNNFQITINNFSRNSSPQNKEEMDNQINFLFNKAIELKNSFETPSKEVYFTRSNSPTFPPSSINFMSHQSNKEEMAKCGAFAQTQQRPFQPVYFSPSSFSQDKYASSLSFEPLSLFERENRQQQNNSTTTSNNTQYNLSENFTEQKHISNTTVQSSTTYEQKDVSL